MKNTKKLISLALALIMALTIAACGGNTRPTTNNNTTNTPASNTPGGGNGGGETPPNIGNPDDTIPNNGTPPNVSATMESHRGDKGYFFTTTGDYIVFVRGFAVTRADGSIFAEEEMFYPRLKELGLEATFYTVTGYTAEGWIDKTFHKLVFLNETDAETYLQSVIGGDLNKKPLYTRVDNVFYLVPNEYGIVMPGSDWDISSFTKAAAIAALERGGWNSSNEINYNVIDFYVSNTSVLLPPPSSFVQPPPSSTPTNQDAYMGNAAWLGREINSIHTFYVVGSSADSVWGSDVYTDDSIIAAAAVHAGVIGVGEAGTVTIRLLPGRESYEGTTRNGVTTRSYGSWNGSYEFVR